MGKQNKRVNAEDEDDVILNTEVKKKQKKENQQARGDHFNQDKTESVEVKAEGVFSPNVEHQKKQHQKKEKQQAVGDHFHQAKNEPVEVKAEDVFSPNMEQKKKQQQQKKEKHQSEGDHFGQAKNEPVELKGEDFFSPNVEQKKQQQKKDKHQPVGDLTNKVKNEPVEGDTTQEKKKQKKKQQAVGDPNVKVKSERVSVKAPGDVTPNTEQKKNRQQKKEKQQAVGGKNNKVKIEPNPTIRNTYNGPVSVSVIASEPSPRKKKEKTQVKGKELAEKNVQDHVVEPASNGAGKKRKRKQRKEEEVVSGNAKIEGFENVSNVMGDEISEGFEAVTDSKTIAVSGFQYDMRKKKIFAHFKGCGIITQIIMSSFSGEGKFRGLAFIEFEAEDAAERALHLDGTKMKDVTLKVELSKVKPKTKGPIPKISGCKIAYIGNLPKVVEEDDIRQFFKDSKIESINLALFQHGKRRCCGFGHVLFADDESLENAMKKNNLKLYDKPIKVAYPTEKYIKLHKKEGHGV